MEKYFSRTPQTLSPIESSLSITGGTDYICHYLFSCGLDDQNPDDWGDDPEREVHTLVRREPAFCHSHDEPEEEEEGGLEEPTEQR